ncbi:hypothetical protein OMW63_12220, partial [Bacillus pacificus]|nr:hypothetical protein [Bacillus pacificus]
KKGLVAGYFSKFYYFILFSVTKIKKDFRVLGTPKGFPNTLKKGYHLVAFFIFLFYTFPLQ